MSIQIRRARAIEVEQLTELVIRSKQSNGYDDAFMQACRDELTITEACLAQGEYWVASDHSLCGCACLVTNIQQCTGEVQAFFVDPLYQRQGVGQLLWQTLHQRATDLKLTTLTLDADPAAVPFYHKLGFSTYTEVPSGSIPGRMLPQMRFAL